MYIQGHVCVLMYCTYGAAFVQSYPVYTERSLYYKIGAWRPSHTCCPAPPRPPIILQAKWASLHLGYTDSSSSCLRRRRLEEAQSAHRAWRLAEHLSGRGALVFVHLKKCGGMTVQVGLDMEMDISIPT